MVVFIRFSKSKKYIFLGLIIILTGIGISSWNDDIKSTKVFINQTKNVILEAEIQKIFDIRNNAILEEDIEVLENIYNKESSKGLWSYEYEVDKIKYLNQWMGKQSATFSKINSKVFLRTVKEVGDGYSVNVAISTKYDYGYNDSTVSNNSFIICTYHSLDLIPNKDRWMISMEWYSDPFVNAADVEKIDTEEIRAVILSGVEKDISNLNEGRLGAVNYASEYSGVAKHPDYNFEYNNKYKNYNNLGGNCTNFASQTLFEGGGFSKTSLWNYSDGEGSRAWVNAGEFNNYMLYSGRASLILKGSYEEVLKSSYDLLPGDYIAFEKKGRVAHIGIVSGIDPKGYSLVNTHNPDFDKVPWDLGWSGDDVKFWLVRVNY